MAILMISRSRGGHIGIMFSIWRSHIATILLWQAVLCTLISQTLACAIHDQPTRNYRFGNTFLNINFASYALAFVATLPERWCATVTPWTLAEPMKTFLGQTKVARIFRGIIVAGSEKLYRDRQIKWSSKKCNHVHVTNSAVDRDGLAGAFRVWCLEK